MYSLAVHFYDGILLINGIMNILEVVQFALLVDTMPP